MEFQGLMDSLVKGYDAFEVHVDCDLMGTCVI